MKTHKATGKDYYALLCKAYKGGPTISGVYGSRAEADDVAEEIKNCAAAHVIKKVSVTVVWK